MARRHNLTPGDWPSVARRLEELIAAGTGEPPLDVVLELLLAKLVAERTGAPFTPEALLRLHAAAMERWAGIFDAPCLPRVPAGVRHAAVDALAPLRVDAAHESALDAIFEGLTSRRRRSDKGQFFTPRTVCAALARLVPLPPRARLLDPACGSGGLLAAALEVEPTLRTTGVDVDTGALRVAQLLQLLAGRQGAWQHGDALRPGTLEEGAWDVILSNPPFAGDLQDPALTSRYAISQVVRPERDVLFVERCLQLLRPGGALGLVLPAGRLAAKRQAPLRRWLLAHLQIHAVVSLPPETFQPHTPQRAALVVGQRRPAPLPETALPANEAIVFSVSERAGRDRRGRPVFRASAPPEARPWVALDHDLDEVVAQVHAARSPGGARG